MWGLRRLEYLKSERPGTYTMLMIKGLWEHLVEIDKAANELEDRIIEEMCKAEGVTEELKSNNQPEWVGLMNSVKNRVREVVYDELIYT
jgi:ribosomal protein S6